MTKQQVRMVSDRLVAEIAATSTPIDKLPKLVNTLLNFEHGVFELAEKRKHKIKTVKIGLNHE